MRELRTHWAWRLVAAALLVLPAALSINAWRMLGEIDEIRATYLRNQAGAVAAHIEQNGFGPSLGAEEPSLLEVRLYEKPVTPELATLWRGERLYVAEEGVMDGRSRYRLWIPVNTEEGFHVARIDIAPESAEYLTARARSNLTFSLIASGTLVVLLGFAIISQERQRRLEADRERVEHLAHIGRMGAVLAHEIRNPLGAMKGFVQLAAERATPDVSALLSPVVDQVTRLEELVRDLLLFARPPHSEPRDVCWCEIAPRLEAAAPDIVSVEPGSVCWRTDPNLLEQILWNLVRNAAEAVEGIPDGRVEVSASEAGVRVMDNGPGIGKEARPRLYEPFFTTKARGTGLGLAIARRLAEAIDAELVLDNRVPKGTSAEVRWKTA